MFFNIVRIIKNINNEGKNLANEEIEKCFSKECIEEELQENKNIYKILSSLDTIISEIQNEGPAIVNGVKMDLLEQIGNINYALFSIGMLFYYPIKNNVVIEDIVIPENDDDYITVKMDKLNHKEYKQYIILTAYILGL